MKKQVSGIILFALIAGFWISVYRFYSDIYATDCGGGASMDKCIAPPTPMFEEERESRSVRVEDVKINLDYVEASARNRTVKARIALDWHGRGQAPKNVWLQLKFHNERGDVVGRASSPAQISNAFEARGGRTFEPVFDCSQCGELPRNIYATATVWPGDADGAFHARAGEMKPVLMAEKN